MLILDTAVNDALQVVTGAAVANLMVHASWVDNASGAVTPTMQNYTISTATTTTIVAAPASGHQINVKTVIARNTHASSSIPVTLQLTDGTNVVPIWYGMLGPGMTLMYSDVAGIQVFTAGGALMAPRDSGALFNQSTSSVSAAYASDTYVAGSSILVPAQGVRIGTRFKVTFDMTKTAAGLATPIVTLRFGTNGSTADAAICTFTFAAGTAAADTGVFEVDGVFRSVGAGTAAVVQGSSILTSNLTTTGLSNAVKAKVVTSSGFDSTVANSILGVSFNGGASFSGTNTIVLAELKNL